MDDEDDVAGTHTLGEETKVNEIQKWWSVKQPAGSGNDIQRKQDLDKQFIQDDGMRELEEICHQRRGGLSKHELELLKELGGHVEHYVASAGHVEGFLAYRQQVDRRRLGHRHEDVMSASLQKPPEQLAQLSSPEPSDPETPPLTPQLTPHHASRRSSRFLSRRSSRHNSHSSHASGPSAHRFRTNSSAGISSGGLDGAMAAMNMLSMLPEEMTRVGSKGPQRGTRARHSIAVAGKHNSCPGQRRSLVQAGAAMSGTPRPGSSGPLSVKLLPHTNT